MKSFIEPQVGYCPLIWMFHGRWMNNKISYFHKHSLRLAYIKITIGISKTNLRRITCYCSSWKYSVTWHRVTQGQIESFKYNERYVTNQDTGIYFKITDRFWEIFFKKFRFGLNSLRYSASKVWNIVPLNIKRVQVIFTFLKRK